MTRQLLRGAIAGVAAAISIGSAAAQDVPPPPAPAVPCELHVWPAAGIDSMYYGWTHGRTVNGAAKGRVGYPAIPSDPLSLPIQRAALAEVPIARFFGVPDATVIMHDQPLDRRDLRADAPRHATSTARCYDELILSKMFYEDAVFAGRSLRILYAFREFGDGATPTASFTTWTATDLSIFPPKLETERAAAMSEIVTAFKGSIRDFAASHADHVREAKGIKR